MDPILDLDERRALALRLKHFTPPQDTGNPHENWLRLRAALRRRDADVQRLAELVLAPDDGVEPAAAGPDTPCGAAAAT